MLTLLKGKMTLSKGKMGSVKRSNMEVKRVLRRHNGHHLRKVGLQKCSVFAV